MPQALQNTLYFSKAEEVHGVENDKKGSILGPIWDPFWAPFRVHFGTHFGSFRAPFWDPFGDTLDARKVPQALQNTLYFSKAAEVHGVENDKRGSILGPIWGPFWVPFGVHFGSHLGSI